MFHGATRLNIATYLRSCSSIRNKIVRDNLKVVQFRSCSTKKTDLSSLGISPSMAAKNVGPKQLSNAEAQPEHKHTNRLINEKSPYLLQHAHNPVDWYPWGEEAIQKAKDENKLIFLSVGYSTCHWCHVMEKESFENEEIAEIMNENFVNIKVDREERPDIDKLYMTFILLINGSGGWPMSVWLTPDLAPFTGGTYFPPKDRWGMPGFVTILLKLKIKWATDKDSLVATGRSVIEAIKKQVSDRYTEEPANCLTPEGKFHQAVNIYRRNFDPDWGGSNGAPKFPEVSKLNLIFHAHIQEPKNKILGIVLNTLNKMANGGIHDHVFGGFARYSVDEKWHVPHFEKMLYDQGQLLMAYTNGYKVTKNQFYLDVADKIFNYICKDLLHPGGGFYSGEDADSLPNWVSKDKIEGAFYAWTYSEIKSIIQDNIGKFKDIGNLDPVDVYTHHYDVKETGNVLPASDPHGHLLGKNILIVYGSVKETAAEYKTTPETITKILEVANCLLHEVRDKRPRPHLDTKIICAWNGLILSGLSQLSCIKDAPKRSEYLRVAKKQVEFIRNNLYDANKKKLYRSCYGDASGNATKLEHPIPGFLDDYAFLIKGLIDYYTATLDADVLHWAKDLQDIQDSLFWDDGNGGYFYSEADSTTVVVRLKEDHDGAEPCGNSVAAYNLLLLTDYFEDDSLKAKSAKLFEYFANSSPFGYILPEMMSSLLLQEHGRHTLIVVGPDTEDSCKLVDAVRDFYLPGLVIHHLKVDKPDVKMTRTSVKNFKMIKNLPTAYVCHNKKCHLPVTEPEQLADEFRAKLVFECDEDP